MKKLVALSLFFLAATAYAQHDPQHAGVEFTDNPHAAISSRAWSYLHDAKLDGVIESGGLDTTDSKDDIPAGGLNDLTSHDSFGIHELAQIPIKTQTEAPEMDAASAWAMFILLASALAVIKAR
jgi:hypothetical protein